MWLTLTVDTTVCHILTRSDQDVAWKSYLREGNKTHIFVASWICIYSLKMNWKITSFLEFNKMTYFSWNLASLPSFGLLQLLVCIIGGQQNKWKHFIYLLQRILSFSEDLMDFGPPWNINKWFMSLNQINYFCSIVRFISYFKIQDYLVMKITKLHKTIVWAAYQIMAF